MDRNAPSSSDMRHNLSHMNAPCSSELVTDRVSHERSCALRHNLCHLIEGHQ